jgi:hypothetical protein
MQYLLQEMRRLRKRQGEDTASFIPHNMKGFIEQLESVV